ncbi:type 1 fimbrial protein [Pseudomonas sp. p1(2021b)]|uniref:fimbrial protein n=1 Tax=Pseudomonas sp. p1(2021b) TaxID=2874628 RepID=UPI001CCC3BA5|nr:fimbrial protein [Pseudomonas sp. p1(2021b)]UBM24729.1 type 1 fimbrial protein [Pseudomonas sp. p1(2021b)]
MSKKSLLLAALFVGATQTANASDGTISFTGNILDNTCTVTIGSGASADATVTLPDISLQALGTGNTGGAIGFVMNLSSCTGTTKNSVAAFFEDGPNVDYSTGRLVNTATTDASNVELELFDMNSDKVIKVGDLASQIADNHFATYAASPGTATLRYGVRYHAPGVTVTKGAVTSSVTYSLMYK